MSVTVTNRSNIDITDLNIEQTGTYRTDVFLDEPLLDSTKDYMVSCSALAVPMSDEPMITHDVAVQDLLTVRRRRYTVQAGTAADNLDLGGTQTLSLSAANRIYCLTDFVNMVANWCAQVSNAIANAGLGPGAIVVNQVIAANHPSIDGRVNNGIQLLRVGVTSSGTLRFTGSAVFWDNFYIASNDYGHQLMGLPFSNLCYTQVLADTTADDTHLFQAGLNVTVATPAATLVAAGADRTYAIQCSYTLLRYLEERLYVALEVDLSFPWNATIQNGKQITTHQIATFPVKTDLVSTINSRNTQVITDVSIQTNSNVGRVHFAEKTSAAAQWYPLKTSYSIQNTRVMVYMMRRRYLNTTQTWYFDRKPMKIHKDAVWNASLKFVSVF